MNVTMTEAQPYAKESPLTIVEGTTLTFAVAFWDTVTAASASANVYRTDDGSDVTSIIMPSGSVTISDNVVTLKPATAWSGGFRYVVKTTSTVNGDVWTKKIEVNVRKSAE